MPAVTATPQEETTADGSRTDTEGQPEKAEAHGAALGHEGAAVSAVTIGALLGAPGGHCVSEVASPITASVSQFAGLRGAEQEASSPCPGWGRGAGLLGTAGSPLGSRVWDLTATADLSSYPTLLGAHFHKHERPSSPSRRRCWSQNPGHTCPWGWAVPVPGTCRDLNSPSADGTLYEKHRRPLSPQWSSAPVGGSRPAHQSASFLPSRGPGVSRLRPAAWNRGVALHPECAFCTGSCVS